MTAELVAFLRARLDEDEQVARDAAREHERAVAEYVAARPDGYADPDERADLWTASTNEEEDGTYYAGVWAADGITRVALLDEADTHSADHIARHDPARVLAEVEAKRALLNAMLGPALSTTVARTHDAGIATARFLALAYADHPDYRKEWAP